MSREKLVEKGREVRHWRVHRRPNDTLADLAEAINAIVRGWMTYSGRFYRTEMIPLLRRINTYLIAGPEEVRAAAWVQTAEGVVDQGGRSDVPICSRTGPGHTVSTRLDVRAE